MNNKDIEDTIKQIEQEVELIQHGEKPPDKEMVSLINSWAPDLLEECPKCDVPLWNGLSLHKKNCDGTPILKKYRKDLGAKQYYRSLVDAKSRTNLKKYKPKLYKLWRKNTWNPKTGNHKTGLTINHITPVSVCYKEEWNVEKAAHTNNLEIVTMNENLKLWLEYDRK